MKVRIMSSVKKGLTRVSVNIELTKEEHKLLYTLLEKGSGFEHEIMERVKNVNDLGKLIYSKVSVNEYKHFLRYGEEVIVNQELVTEELLNGVARSIGEYFAEKISQAIDLPEINEVFAEVTLPDSIANELQKRGIDPTYKCVLSIKKDRGFNDFYIMSDIHVSSHLIDASSKITEFYRTFFLSISLPFSKYPHAGSITILPGSNKYNNTMRIPISKFENIEEQSDDIKRILLKQIQEFKDTNIFNLLITSAYRPMNYSKEIHVLDDVVSEYTVKISISRDWLMGAAKLNIEIEALPIKKGRSIVLQLEGEGVKGEVKISPSSNGSVLTSGKYRITSEEVTESRIDRVIRGDFSVVDEVEQQDISLIQSVTEQVQKQLPESVRKVLAKKKIDKQIQSSIDVMDLIPQDKKDQVVAYLVSEKLKNS